MGGEREEGEQAPPPQTPSSVAMGQERMGKPVCLGWRLSAKGRPGLGCPAVVLVSWADLWPQQRSSGRWRGQAQGLEGNLN